MAKPNMIETPDAYKTYIQTKHRSEAAWHEPTWRAVTRGVALALAYVCICIPIVGWVISIPFWFIVAIFKEPSRPLTPYEQAMHDYNNPDQARRRAIAQQYGVTR